MKKKILLILSLIWLVSCSNIEQNPQGEEPNINNALKVIDSAVNKGVAEIEKATVKSLEQIRDTSSDVRKDIGRICNNQINEFNNYKKKLEAGILFQRNVSYAALLLAIISILLSVGHIVSSRRKIRDEIIGHIISSERVKDYISKIVNECMSNNLKRKDGVVKPNTKSLINEIIGSDDFKKLIAKEIDNRVTIQPAKLCPVSNKEEKPIVQQEKETNVVKKGRIELFARDSRTNVLSEIYPSYKTGKTLYKLTMDSQDSLMAELDLCIDKEEVVKGILEVFTNEDLEAICNITQISANPKDINVSKKGRAEKNTDSEWVVVEKIEIEKI